MAMRNASSAPYNPQQWGRNGLVSGQYAPHPVVQTARVQDITGMEGTWHLFLNVDFTVQVQVTLDRNNCFFLQCPLFTASLVILILYSFDAFSSPTLLASPTQ
jgi:hypothetical protein